MRSVHLLYALSGFVALGYQVVWFRLFVERFGSTNLTFILVITNFIGGLGVGALLSEPVTRAVATRLRLRNPLATAGAVELLITASLVLTVVFGLAELRLGGDFPYVPSGQGIYEQSLSYQVVKAVFAVACVFVPCFFMGMTFPLLCSAFPHDGRFPSTLYGWNTLGACAGILACEFLLLPWLGHTRGLVALVALNLVLAAAFFALARRFEPPPAAAPRPRAARSPGAVYHPTVVLALAALSGAVSGAIESDMFRRIRLAGGNSDVAMSFVSFWAILAIFIASWTVRALRLPRLAVLKVAFAAALVVYAVGWHFVYDVREALAGWYMRSVLAGVPPEAAAAAGRLQFFALQGSLPLLLVFVGVFVFPAYFLVSWLLPAVCNRIHGDRRHLGVAYGVNTLAFCAGMVGFGWIAPHVNLFYAVKLTLAFFALAVACVLALRAAQRVPALAVAGAGAVFALAIVLTPADFDVRLLNPKSDAARYPVSAMKSDGAHTTYVVASPSGKRLFFDNHSMSGTSQSDQRYMRLMAHFPLLAHPAPRRALLICFGVGNTAAAIAAHEQIAALDVVDLNGKVFETAPEFAATNDRVYEDRRLTFIHDDGRNFLNRTTRAYDLVTSEPPPPMHEGVYRLYSREYYASILAHLTPQGLMTQWLPIRYMPREAVEMAIATFVRVFPHALAFVGHEHHVILVGGRAPIDALTIERRFDESPRVARDLERFGVRGPVDLLARVVQTDATLRRTYGAGRDISDERNDLAHVVFRPLDPSVVAYDPVAVLAGLDARRLASGARLEKTLGNLALLKSAVPDFPAASLVTARDAPVAFAGVDWVALERLNRTAAQAAQAGRTAEAVALFERSLGVAGDQLDVLAGVATLKGRTGDHAGALAAWRRREVLDPEDPLTLAGITRELAATGRAE
jgi:spermidine synthase